MHSDAPRPLPAAAMAATVLLWGSAFVGIRATLPALGYANLASGRLLLGALTLVVLARRIGVRRPTRSQVPLLAALGPTGYAGYQLLLSAGEQTVPAGTSALLFAGAPVLAAVLARPILRERLSARKWSGLAVAVTGVAVVATTNGVSGEGLDGAPLVLAAIVLYAIWVVLQKRAPGHPMSAVDVTAWATWLGAGLCLPFASGLPRAAATAHASALVPLLLLGDDRTPRARRAAGRRTPRRAPRGRGGLRRRSGARPARGRARAARLRGAAEIHKYDQPQSEVEARIEAAFLHPARLRCGAHEWEGAMREGAALSFEDAIAYAIEEPRLARH